MSRMIVYEKRPLEKTLGKVENKFYNLIGIDKYQQMTWKEYFLALLVVNFIAASFFFGLLVFQQYLPLSAKEGFSLDLAFHTAISFVTNTNLQHYIGDQDMSLLTQMIGITFMMFVAPASGIAATRASAVRCRSACNPSTRGTDGNPRRAADRSPCPSRPSAVP